MGLKAEEKEVVLKELKEAIVSGDVDSARRAAEKAVELGLNPMEVIDKGLKPGLDVVEEKYESLELFLPDLVLAGDAACAALDVLLSRIEKGESRFKKGTVVIGTIYGDIHDIGKSIVAALLRANGYEVYDLGADVEPTRFVEEAERVKADFIAMSCLLTPSMPYMRDVVQRLEDMGVRDRYYVIVGGAAVYPEWAEEIKADGWAKDAPGAVELCDTLMERGKEVKKPVIIGAWGE